MHARVPQARETSTQPGAGIPASSSWTALWRLVTRFEREKVSAGMALRNATGIVVPLVAGAALGETPYAMIASLGAMNVSFSDGSDPYQLRASRMLAASVLGATAIVVGSLAGSNGALAIATAAAWAAGAGMLVALHTAAADIGLLSLVMVLVFSGQPSTPGHALAAGLLAFSGGLLQTVLAVALWPVRRYEPERRVLSTLFSELGRIAASSVEVTAAPPASAHATEAQALLSGLWRSSSIQGARYLSLLAQAERIRLSLLLLGRLRNRLYREGAVSEAVGVLDACFEATSDILASIASSLDLGAHRANPDRLTAVLRSSERLREVPQHELSVESRTMLDDARHHLDALTGQLRSALQLAASSTEVGRHAFDRKEATQPWWLRMHATLPTLRANLSLRSAAFRHALRLTGCVLVGQITAHSLGGERSYWLPMTMVIVLKPDFTATFSRGVLRLGGTFAGLVLATALFHLLQPGPVVEIVLIGVFAFLLRCFGPANYGILVAALSAMIVLLFALAGQEPAAVITERGWYTLLGGSLALLLYAVWPTWERSQVNDTVAGLLDSYREYFRAIRTAYVEMNSSAGQVLDRARMAGRLARSNAEASLERFTAEPGTPPDTARSLSAILASSHRLIHAVMALEAGLARNRPPVRGEFIAFSNHVELTLHSLAGALRGSPLQREELPDLREDHNALIRAGDPLVESYALVNVESDRITNSLNTLREQVLELSGTSAQSE